MDTSQKITVSDCFSCPLVDYSEAYGEHNCYEISESGVRLRYLNQVHEQCPLKKGPIVVELKQ